MSRRRWSSTASALERPPDQLPLVGLIYFLMGCTSRSRLMDRGASCFICGSSNDSRVKIGGSGGGGDGGDDGDGDKKGKDPRKNDERNEGDNSEGGERKEKMKADVKPSASHGVAQCCSDWLLLFCLRSDYKLPVDEGHALRKLGSCCVIKGLSSVLMAPPRSCENPPKRKNYSIKTKLEIISTYAKGVSGYGIGALSKKHGVDPSTLRGWIDKKAELEAALNESRRTGRIQCRLSGGGRKAMYEDLERELEAWILDKKRKGLCVRDQYIQAKAKMIYNQRFHQQAEGGETEVHGFNASSGWLARFKHRKDISSRRRSLALALPDSADDICRSFLYRCHNIIETFNISPTNIFNMDQVFRYFERDATASFSKRANGEELLRKGGNLGKRFTVTFMVSLSGEVHKPHVLFSDLIGKPTLNPGVLVELNPMGMWSEQSFISYVSNTIGCRYREDDAFESQHVLLIIDSYGPHVKLLENDLLKAMNIHIAIIPPKLSGILQPLDVAIKRRFQQYLSRMYDAYIKKAIDGMTIDGVPGGLECPFYQLVTNWVVDWVKAIPPAEVSEAFRVCGLVHKHDFDPDALHPPLKALFDPAFNLTEWNEFYAESFLDAPEPIDLNLLVGPDYFVPKKVVNGDPCSLWQCLHRAKYGPNSEIPCSSYITSVIAGMKTLPDLADITDEEFYIKMENGAPPDYRMVAFAVMTFERWTIRIQDASNSSYMVYEHIDPVKTIDLARVDDFFVLKV
ncbi:hypothetical protein CBR_g22880 [Chara braunii]|uniref:HTH CENPB-type domain-containing protein n=1 Tax=Chara braunii TaxID=69332 RepID=A0A388L386_CHABU|nr:hypothetical protein CBR_g22880 [Chara braunii]|eukprot:GBG76663.1 hypothetical protein CBR_g22880 [Chara braunii]